MSIFVHNSNIKVEIHKILIISEKISYRNVFLLLQNLFQPKFSKKCRYHKIHYNLHLSVQSKGNLMLLVGLHVHEKMRKYIVTKAENYM